MSTRTSVIVSLLLSVLIWGTNFVVIKLALGEIPPLLLALIRFSIASAILLPLTQARGGLALLPRPLPLGTLALMGFTGVTLYFCFFNYALVFTTASEAALVQGASPAVTAGLAMALLGERFTRVRALGIGLSLLGVALIALAGGGGGYAPNPLLGDLLIVASMLSWAIFTISGKRLSHVSQLATTTYSILMGTLLLVPLAALEATTHTPVPISLGSWLAALYLGVAASTLSFFLWNRALRFLDVSQAAIFINLVPLIGVISAAVFLGESILPGQLLGGALAVTGVWLTVRK